MPSNAGVLLQLLGSFIGDSTPQRNPNYDPNDPNSKPYSEPGFGTKFFHPEVAAYESEKNNQGFNEQLANTIANRVAAGNISKVKSLYGKSINDPSVDDTALAILAGRDASANSLLGTESTQQKEAANIPTLNAADVAAGLKVGTREKEAALNTGLPEATVGSQLAGAKYTMKQLPYEEAKLGPAFDTWSMRNAAEQQTIPSVTARTLAENTAALQTIPLETREKMATAQATAEDAERRLFAKGVLDKTFANTANTTLIGSNINQELAKVRERELPLLAGAEENTIREQARQAAHPPTAQSPVYYDNASGEIKVDPSYVNMMNLMNAKLKGGAGIGGSGSIPVGGGLHIVTPKPTGTDSGNKPTIGNNLQGFNFTPVTPNGNQQSTNQPAKQQQQEEPIDTDKFIRQLNTKKSGANQTVALDVIGSHLAKLVTLPENIEGSRYIGSSTIKRPLASVWADIMRGKNKYVSQSQAFDYLRSLPPEQQHAIFEDALKKGGY